MFSTAFDFKPPAKPPLPGPANTSSERRWHPILPTTIFPKFVPFFLIGLYPRQPYFSNTSSWTDPYVAWQEWEGGWCDRWPHPFKPTHYMKVWTPSDEAS